MQFESKSKLEQFELKINKVFVGMMLLSNVLYIVVDGLVVGVVFFKFVGDGFSILFVVLFYEIFYVVGREMLLFCK